MFPLIRKPELARRAKPWDEAVANLREATELYLEVRPDECPQGETVGVGIIKPMKVAVDASILADE